MLVFILVSIFVIGFIGYMFLNNRNMKTYNQYMKRKQKLEESIKDFIATESYVNQNVAIAINRDKKLLCVSTMKNGAPVPLMYRFDSITGSEIMEDGVSILATGNNKSGSEAFEKTQVNAKRSVISNLFVSGERITRIDLKISFDDLQNSYVLANFLFWEITKNSDEYKKAYQDAAYWHNIIDNILKNKTGHALSASI